MWEIQNQKLYVLVSPFVFAAFSSSPLYNDSVQMSPLTIINPIQKMRCARLRYPPKRKLIRLRASTQSQSKKFAFAALFLSPADKSSRDFSLLS